MSIQFGREMKRDEKQGESMYNRYIQNIDAQRGAVSSIPARSVRAESRERM